ncbi:MAG: transporter substrate-binding domain-containing protein [Devosia sp.]
MISVGVLFSTTGPYAALGREGLAGAMTAIEEINEQRGLELIAEFRDPQGLTEQYAHLARDILSNSGARHIIGCTTSWSRKEVIPVLEKSGALLWYPCPYEGFECNEQVIYLGACPNQHVLPLLEYILPRFGFNGYLVGSNYIWGWETSRIARDIIEHSGGRVVGERYVPLGDTDIDRLIEEIRLKRPDFILNTLIGPSSYAFLRAYHELGLADPDFGLEIRPVISCNFAESETVELGAIAAGLYVIAPYFQSLDTEQNRRFVSTARRLGSANPHLSAFFAQAYTAVHMLAAAIVRANTDAPDAVRAAAIGVDTMTPFGPARLDRATNHTVLTPRIGRANETGGFDIVFESTAPIVPDPYLARSNFAAGIGRGTKDRVRQLRVIK